MMHELYCAGHLIEAAVAHFRATSDSRLLDVASRFADHIDARVDDESTVRRATKRSNWRW
ncbi:Beta-L-arabinofuranosidase, GH127 [Halostagnicola kamekurae]|uniref:Beta-L-arabinofuranosidase, GH127 n=1 Tax=Halostagnicola kamekurae TaxID=619731 RepID=A0A1I6TLF2_9EURY|nr:Beta-L-arabinofuranosidase, GH127 [Halostagnicola kamekurae]